jgi:hypothetical protein
MNSIDKTDSNISSFNSLPLILSIEDRSKSGFTYVELKNYSYLLAFIVIVGFICHIFVLIILIYQQVKRRLISKKLKKRTKLENHRTFMDFTRNRYIASMNVDSNNKIDMIEDDKINNNEILILEKNSTRNLNESLNFETSNKCKLKINQDYRNYVTYAFVFHQTIVDLLRIFYSLMYSNRIYNEYKINYKNLNQEIDSNSISTGLNIFYERYCTQMASFYSVLTMVTIVNILTILISETCRYYDLKFNTSDTSNYCCVIFGIMLIWISSLIIISSLMLVGVVESAAPTWNCDMGEAESTTRSLVINITWFLLVAFILIIAFSYSISLYRELSSLLDSGSTAESFFSALPSRSHNSLEDEIYDRHNMIVKETLKRLLILSLLIVVFCATFLPHFIATLLKNILQTNTILLNPYNLISCIISLSNSSINSIILLILCVKSKETCLSNIFYSNENNQYSLRKNEKNMKARITKIIQRIIFSRFSCRKQCLNDKINLDNSNLNNKTVENENEICTSSVLNCNEDCMQLNVIKNCSNTADINFQKQVNNLTNPNNPTTVGSKNPTNVKEFYSKIGNRLGNL